MTNPLSDPEFVAGLRPVPSGLGDETPSWPAADVAGLGPDGIPVAIDLAAATRPVLLVFLTTNCDGCDLFWRGLAAEAPTDVDVVVVTKGPGTASASEVADLAGDLAHTPVVMSDAAWSDFRVTGYPFLVLVEPATRRILRESVGFGWDDIAMMLDTPRKG